MGKALMRVLGGLAGLLLLAGLVLLISWWWPLSAAQKRALEVLEAPREVPGSNAYVTLATLGMKEGTLAQRQVQVDAYAAEYAKWHADFRAFAIKTGGKWEEGDGPEKPQWPPVGQETPAMDTVLCRSTPPSCLSQVRAQPQAAAAALMPFATLLELMDELATHGHYRSPLPADGATPYPPINLLSVPLSAHALAHVQGDSQRALAGVCRDAGIGRMLMNHGDSLLIAMVGNQMLDANARLFAEVLAELPADAPVPAECAVALAPLSPQEACNCAGMQGEFAMVRDGYAMYDEVNNSGLELPGEHWWVTPTTMKAMYNRDKTVARVAETMAQACLPETWQAIAEDQPLQAMPLPSNRRLECAANAFGCILTSISAPAYRQYVARPRDTAAQLRMLQAVLWLRGHAAQQAGIAVPDRLQQLPAELLGARRPVTVSADGAALETPAYREGGDTVRTPLPQALQQRQ